MGAAKTSPLQILPFPGEPGYISGVGNHHLQVLSSVALLPHSPPNELLRLLKVRSVVKGFQALALPRFQHQVLQGVPVSSVRSLPDAGSSAAVLCRASSLGTDERRVLFEATSSPGLVLLFRASLCIVTVLAWRRPRARILQVSKVSRFVTVTDGKFRG